MHEKTMLIEEKIFFAARKLLDVKWQVAKDGQVEVIMDQIEDVERDLTGIKRGLQREQNVSISGHSAFL
ncbi:hypothetical protein ACTID9_08685 [Brevibacillus fluminis]|uniref:hypothetical protein n=1 Tax=Brevibacillus fluminis TaxID=511487 RepID=UPI003F8971DB